jgi:hypothetical protein
MSHEKATGSSVGNLFGRFTFSLRDFWSFERRESQVPCMWSRF